MVLNTDVMSSLWLMVEEIERLEGMVLYCTFCDSIFSDQLGLFVFGILLVQHKIVGIGHEEPSKVVLGLLRYKSSC